MNRVTLLAVACTFAVICGQADAETPGCAGLVQLKLAGATISSAALVEAGAFKTPDGRAMPKLPAFCRVVASAKPSSDSDIRFEVWLPVADWNGRIWGVGNGNFAGSIAYPGLAGQLSEGYATVSTNTGHEAKAMDSKWANGHPEKIIDFGYRGVHEAIVHAKSIVTAFYNQAPGKSYFGSCSNGGRQALMEALRYPADYDGIIAGAPASPYTQYFIGYGQTHNLFSEPAHRLTSGKVEALRSAALAACDGLDGVKDGVIENPAQCKFDPGALACKDTETEQCLTPPQLETVRALYGGYKVATDQNPVAGFAPGSEANWFSVHFGENISKASIHQFGIGFFQDFVFGDSTWDFKSYDTKRDGALVNRRISNVLNSDSADLNAFIKRGGKLILYHGWNDPLLPAHETVAWYQRVRAAMGEAKTNEAVRLFMVPGMEHCIGGAGADRFGQFAGGSGDSDNSMGAALQRWVEKDVAPERIVAGKLKEVANPAAGFARTHPLCAYPKVAKYRGEGSTDSAASFECKVPE